MVTRSDVIDGCFVGSVLLLTSFVITVSVLLVTSLVITASVSRVVASFVDIVETAVGAEVSGFAVVVTPAKRSIYSYYYYRFK